MIHACRGLFSTICWLTGPYVSYIARWDGSAWLVLGTGVNNFVYALAVNGSDLYVDGQFNRVGGKVSTYLAKAPLLPPVSEIAVAGNGNTITIGDSTPSRSDHTDFGSTNVNSGMVVRTFTIQNSGTGALTDVGPGDGPTMVIPGSHKSNLPHPNAGNYANLDRMDHLDGAVPVYLNAGDAVIFVDGIMHGGSSRTNTTGERRVTIFRYGVSWAATRALDFSLWSK